MFLRARRWPVGACVFHIQPAKWALSFYQLQKLSPPSMCDKIVWLAHFTERRVISAWTSPWLPPGVPSVMPSVIVLGKTGQNRRLHQTVWHQPVSCNNCFNSLHLQRAQVTDSQKPISTVMRVCRQYSIHMWQYWVPGNSLLSFYLIWNPLCSQDNTRKWLDLFPVWPRSGLESCPSLG